MKIKRIVLSITAVILILSGITTVGVLANDKKSESGSRLNQYFEDSYQGNVIVKMAKPTENITKTDTQPKKSNLDIAESLYQELNTMYPNQKIKVYLVTGGEEKKPNEARQQFIVAEPNSELADHLLNNPEEAKKLNNYIHEKAEKLDNSLAYGRPIDNDQIIFSNSYIKRNVDVVPFSEKNVFTIQYSKDTNIQKMLGGTYFE